MVADSCAAALVRAAAASGAGSNERCARRTGGQGIWYGALLGIGLKLYRVPLASTGPIQTALLLLYFIHPIKYGLRVAHQDIAAADGAENALRHAAAAAALLAHIHEPRVGGWSVVRIKERRVHAELSCRRRRRLTVRQQRVQSCGDRCHCETKSKTLSAYKRRRLTAWYSALRAWGFRANLQSFRPPQRSGKLRTASGFTSSPLTIAKQPFPVLQQSVSASLSYAVRGLRPIRACAPYTSPRTGGAQTKPVRKVREKCRKGRGKRSGKIAGKGAGQGAGKVAG